MLTEREIRIVIKLLESRVPLRIKDFAQEFEVSTRAISYDLERVKEWFTDMNMQVLSHSNKGIWVSCQEDERERALQHVLKNGRLKQNPDQNYRIKKILRFLLLTNNYMTAAEFANELQVSRNTILADMDSVSDYIQPWNLQLERARRIGYKIHGEELHFRFLLEHLLYADMTNYEIYQIMTRIDEQAEVSEEEFLMDRMLFPIYRVAERHLSQIYTSDHAQTFHQSDLLTLLVRITISIARLNLGHAMTGYRVLNKEKYKDEFSSFILLVMEEVFKEQELPLLEYEYLYLSGEMARGTRGIDLIQATSKIIDYVSEKEGVAYWQDAKLFSNLHAHLSFRLKRGLFNLSESNPFAENIKREHSRLFGSVMEACQQHLDISNEIKKDCFISLIALHFLSSFENFFSKQVKVRALYVCSTGRGVARLIKNRVEKEILDIDMVAYCSIMEVGEFCKKENVDLIISVFPIKSPLPVIVVEAIPNESNLEAIRTVVENTIRRKPAQYDRILFENQAHPGADVEQVSQDIILKGFEVLHEILSAFKGNIDEEREQALSLHIFLMVHRYYFDKDYDDYLFANHPISEKYKQDIETIKTIFKNLDLNVRETEIIALLQYL